LRIKDRGVIAFVTNGGFLDSNTANGMRQALAEEFNAIHVYNLRGNQRTAGEQSRKEGGKVFNAGSRATVAITVFVKDPIRPGLARIHYTDIGDYLTRDNKLRRIAEAGALSGLEPAALAPNPHGDWLNQRRDDFMGFVPLGSSDESGLLSDYGPGPQTNRDAWVYNASAYALRKNMLTATLTYDEALNGARTNETTSIKWSSALESRLARGEGLPMHNEPPVTLMYRPFELIHAHWDPKWLHRPGAIHHYYPNSRVKNHGFFVPAVGSMAPPFCALTTSGPVDSGVAGIGAVYYFARWRYEVVSGDAMLDVGGQAEIGDGCRRIDNITDAALARFRSAYGDSFTKDDAFYYVYGLLHSPDYRKAYAADLKKMLPRIPLVETATPFIGAGRTLSEIHLGYENVTAYPLDGLDVEEPAGPAVYDFFRVEKMRFGKPTAEQQAAGQRADRTTIVYNDRITLRGIPEAAYRYMLGSRSAIEWIMDRYQVKTDKPSGIVNDPNDWSREVEDPRYIIDLLARIVTVSLETMQIVDDLPPLAIRADQNPTAG